MAGGSGAGPVIAVAHVHPERIQSRWWLPGVLAVALVALLTSPAHAQVQEPLPPELEVQAQALYESVMCPQCAGQTISQSTSQIAKAMRAAVRDGLLAGESPEQVLDSLVASFGEEVLASPPKRGLALLVWLGPPIALVLGGAAVALAVRGLRRGAGQDAAQDGPQGAIPARGKAASDLAPYLDMVDREIGEA